MEQSPINQRLKFLAEKLAGNAHAFGVAIGDKTANTHKYINGNTRPNPDYLEKALLRFGSINARWLLTGEGEAFISDTPLIIQPQQNNQKNNQGNIVGNITGGNPTFNTLADCAKENEHLRSQVELLNRHLDEKERTIQILLSQQSRPQ